MQNQSSSPTPPDTRSAARLQSDPAEARRRLAETFRSGELIWLVAEKYDQHADSWSIDIIRQTAFGRWMRQRYRYDQQAEVLYFLGASALSDAEFNAARANGTLFPTTVAKS